MRASGAALRRCSHATVVVTVDNKFANSSTRCVEFPHMAAATSVGSPTDALVTSL